MSHNLTPTKAIRLATDVAQQSTMRHRMGAVLYDKSNYTVGYNRAFGVEVASRERIWSMHAEEVAILKGVRIGIDFENSTLVIVRVNRSGILRCSRPCKVCEKLIEKVGIRRIFFISA